MKTALVTGANRGLGLEFCRQLLASDYQVMACCRDPDSASQLTTLSSDSQLDVLELDIGVSGAINNLVNLIANKPIDLLINNAGVYGGSEQSLMNCQLEPWLDTLHINAIAPVFLTRQLLPNLKRSSNPKIAFLTSKMGSMGDNGSGGSYIYRSSKAALNASIKSMAVDLMNRIPVVALHPGWVRTDMGGPNGLIDAPESVSGMLSVVEKLDFSHSGRFYDFKGTIVPW